MARICFSILFPLCSFTICHSCILNMEISVKHFSGTARHRMMKFGTNIGYDKLYCVRKNQPSPAYQSLYSSIFLSLIEISVTEFSAPIYSSFFKVCIPLDNAQVYCVRENQMARICFSILFPLCSFTICHILNMEISVKHFSGTARHRMMKFGTNIGYDKLYCVRKNQPSPAYQSLYSSIFLSLIEISVTDFSAPVYVSFFKVCIHLDNAQVYCVREHKMARICFSILFPLVLPSVTPVY